MSDNQIISKHYRDQQRARALGLEDTHTEKIILMSMEEFNVSSGLKERTYKQIDLLN